MCPKVANGHHLEIKSTSDLAYKVTCLWRDGVTHFVFYINYTTGWLYELPSCFEI